MYRVTDLGNIVVKLEDNVGYVVTHKGYTNSYFIVDFNCNIQLKGQTMKYILKDWIEIQTELNRGIELMSKYMMLGVNEFKVESYSYIPKHNYKPLTIYKDEYGRGVLYIGYSIYIRMYKVISITNVNYIKDFSITNGKASLNLVVPLEYLKSSSTILQSCKKEKPSHLISEIFSLYKSGTIFQLDIFINDLIHSTIDLDGFELN